MRDANEQKWRELSSRIVGIRVLENGLTRHITRKEESHVIRSWPKQQQKGTLAGITCKMSILSYQCKHLRCIVRYSYFSLVSIKAGTCDVVMVACMFKSWILATSWPQPFCFLRKDSSWQRQRRTTRTDNHQCRRELDKYKERKQM